MGKRLEKKHPLAIRWQHWINFPLLTMMIWSGMLIYWANPVYSVKVGGYELFHFFPAWFYEIYNVDFWGFKIPDYFPEWSYIWLGLDHRLAEGLQMHHFWMWLFAVNGLIYVVYLVLSGEWRALLPVPGSLKRALFVTLHDAHIVRDLPPQGKYNDAQRIAYTGVILMGAGSVLTGLAIYKSLQLSWLTALFGGYEWARWIHFWLTIGFVVFFLVHVIQVALAGWANFRSMVSGYDVIDAETPAETAVIAESEVPA